MHTVYEYVIDYFDWESGVLKSDTIVGVDDAHAYEEATYECHGEILRVTKGARLYDE